MTKNTYLFILDQFSYGGATSIVRQHIQILLEKNHKILIIGGQGNINLPSKYFPNCTCLVVPHTPQWGSKIFLWAFPFYKLLLRTVFTYKIDIIHITNFHAALLTPFFPPFFFKKLIYTFCGDYALEEVSRHSQVSKIKTHIRFFLQYLILLRADQIISLSKYAKKLMISRYPKTAHKKISIINPYVEGIYREKRSLIKNTQKLVILTISRFEPRKGIIELLRACALLKKEKVNFELILAGPVSDYHFYEIVQEYERLGLLDQVRFLHKVDTDQKERLYSQASVFAMPSQDLETFGVTVLEALCNGLPVIGTPAGAIPEVLSHIDSRLITKNTSPEAIAQKLKWYSKLEKKEIAQIKLKISEKVNSDLSRKNVEKKVLQVYS